MSVMYPDDLRLTDAQHAALAAQDEHAQSGELTEAGKTQARFFHDANEAAAAAEAEALAAEEGEVPDEAPNATWTVAQLDAYAAEHDISDYPATGKADKLAAIEAA